MSTPVRSIASQIYVEIHSVWSKANIPTKSEKVCIETLVRLLSSWSTFSTNANKCDPSSEKYIKYKGKLAEVCDLAIGKNEEETKYFMASTKLPTWERDFQFYINQKNGVSNDILEGSDSNHRERWKRMVARNQKVLKRKGKEESHCSKTKEDAEEANKMMEESTDEYENVDDAIADPDVRGASWYQEQFERRNKNSKPDTVILEVPHRNLSKVLSPSASRMKLSVRQSLVCASNMIRVGKGKVSDFAISKTTFQRQRKAGEAELPAKLMSMFLNNPKLKYIVVHWDGKKVKYMDGKIEEHIVLILQAVNSGMPPQFVGAPMVATASGKNMKDVIVQYL